MTRAVHSTAEAALVARQLGRTPREPWRVGSLCAHGFPTTIVSSPTLADGTPFPTFAWLTCPWLTECLGAEESAGGTAAWASRADVDRELSRALRDTDAALRRERAQEAGGIDPCFSVGIAGQRDPLGVKCLHAHVALQLAGVGDPIGAALLGKIGTACADARCAGLLGDTTRPREDTLDA